MNFDLNGLYKHVNSDIIFSDHLKNELWRTAEFGRANEVLWGSLVNQGGDNKQIH